MIAAAQSERGLTVAETLVALLVAAALALGVFYLASGRRRSYDAELERLTRREDLHTALAFIERQIGLAGYGLGGCADGVVLTGDGRGGRRQTAYRALQVHPGCNLWQASAQRGCMGSDSSDSLTVTYVDPDDGALGRLAALPLAEPLVDAQAPLVLEHAGAIAPCDLLVLSHPERTDECFGLVATRVVRTPTGVAVEHGVQGGRCGERSPERFNRRPPLPAGGLPRGALVARIAADMRPRHFAIDRGLDPPALVTWTSAAVPPSGQRSDVEVLVQGIETLRLEWECVAGGGRGRSRCAADPRAHLVVTLLQRAPTADLPLRRLTGRARPRNLWR